MLVDVLAAVALTAWLFVLLLPSGSWRTRERLEPEANQGAGDQVDLRSVSVLIPARNEAHAITETLAGLVRQGEGLQVFVIDDESDDATAEVARKANVRFSQPLDLTIVDGQPLPSGWGGKLWALEQGLRRVEREYCLLLDAEIELSAGMLAALFRKARNEDRAMVSIMAKLRCQGFWEKLLVPPFIFFFKLLYPFALVNESNRSTAAAAGGCVLIRTDVLRETGGFAAIKDALIDDCSLAAQVKAAGESIWLGLSESVASSRPYRNLADFRRMVTRTAFTQLNYSAVLLALVVVIMSVVFIVPFASLFFATRSTGVIAGACAIAAMSVAYWPTVRFYRLKAPWVLTLPLAGVLFLAMTLESAFKYWRGVTASWKGRTYTSGR